MKDGIILDSKDIKEIIQRFFEIKEENIVQTKYSFMLVGVSADNIKDKLANKK